ncbi:MAG TPA: hypothetical protein VKB65_10595 [Myxococcota bacterium]|nr:hypothetical protein [Myxococcota bacterium]
METHTLRPGLIHWTERHPKIHIEVSSYWIADAHVLLDPLVPAGGLDWLEAAGPPEHVILTNRHHWRHSSEIVARFGCAVWCNELGLHELDGEPGRDHVRGFRAGEALPGGIESHEVGVLCPDETALRFVLADGRACLAVADGVVRMGEGARGDGPLAFVPDFLIADDAAEVERIQRGLREAYGRLCDLEWDTLLLAHGLPLVGDGREALRAFASG